MKENKMRKQPFLKMLGVRVPQYIIDWLEECAERNKRSKSSQVFYMLEKLMKEDKDAKR
jgi:hypothetical protein